MQVRRARPEKPSTLVRDLNPDVERFINRALRADPDKRWQSAEQMADRIDAILVKLGQPSGPAPLKRWLETLSARDGAKPPVADAAAASDPSIAVELGQPGPGARGGRGGRVDDRRRGSGHGPRDASAPRARRAARPTRPRGRTRRVGAAAKAAADVRPAAAPAGVARASSAGCAA